MNFKNLMSKLQSIEENLTVEPVTTDAEVVTNMEECGMEVMPTMPPKQQDNVTMNVSMNGSGAGGIRDLMAILKNIEGADQELPAHDDDSMIVGMEEELANSPAPEVADIDAVTPTGDDLASKGGEAPKVNGGGNPFNVSEALVSHLAQMYDEIKEGSHQEKTTMKHIKDPTEGEKKAAKDIKPGVNGYKDRADMLKSAEKEGRLKD